MIDLPYKVIHEAVDLAMSRRHRGMSRADARQEAYLAVLEWAAQGQGSVDLHEDVAEVARQAVNRYGRRMENRTGSGPLASLTPEWQGYRASSLDSIGTTTADMAGWADANLPPAPSAEDDYLSTVEDPDRDAAEAALAALDPLVRAWVSLVLLDGMNGYAAARSLQIGTNAAERLMRASGLNEEGRRKGDHGPGGSTRRVNIQGLVGLDARGRAVA